MSATDQLLEGLDRADPETLRRELAEAQKRVRLLPSLIRAVESSLRVRQGRELVRRRQCEE